MRSSAKFSHQPINEYFYEAWMSDGQDERAGDTEGPSSFALFRFPQGEDPESIDAYNEQRDGFEDQLNADEIIMLCTKMVGCIVRERGDGFVDADLFTDATDLEIQWQRVLDDTTLEQCDECQEEADEYGAGQPIVHLAHCSSAD